VVWLHAGDKWGNVLAGSVKYGKVQSTICVVWGFFYFECVGVLCVEVDRRLK